MKELKHIRTLIFVVMLMVIMVFWIWYTESAESDSPMPAITVAAYTNGNNKRWRAMEQGIVQACTEVGIQTPDINYIKRSESEQIDQILQREVGGGNTHGVLLASADKVAYDAVMGMNQDTPIILLENSMDGQYTCIAADNYAMGETLAEYLSEKGGNIAVLQSGLDREYISERNEGFMRKMDELDTKVITLWYDPANGDLKSYLASTIATYVPKIDALVILDNDSLEIAIDAIPAAMVDVELSGIGSSEKVVHALDKGSVHSIVYQNEYAAGYIATMKLAEQMGIINYYSQEPIQYKLVTHDNMYLKETERFIFPIN